MHAWEVAPPGQRGERERLCPSLESQLWDYDKTSPNDRVGTVFLKFDDIQTRPLVPTWVNVYGACELCYRCSDGAVVIMASYPLWLHGSAGEAESEIIEVLI